MSGYEVLRKQLAKESKIVASDSMAVLEEFEEFEESLPGGPMKSFRKELWLEVPTRRAFINITPEVEEYVRESGITEGLVLVKTKII